MGSGSPARGRPRALRVDSNLTVEPKTSQSNVSLHFVADNCPNDRSPISPLYRAEYSRRGFYVYPIRREILK